MSDTNEQPSMTWEQFFGGPRGEDPFTDSPEMSKLKSEAEQFYIKCAVQDYVDKVLTEAAIMRLKAHPELIDEATEIFTEGDPENLNIPLMEAVRLYEEVITYDTEKRPFEILMAKVEIHFRAKESLKSI